MLYAAPQTTSVILLSSFIFLSVKYYVAPPVQQCSSAASFTAGDEAPQIYEPADYNMAQQEIDIKNTENAQLREDLACIKADVITPRKDG